MKDAAEEKDLRIYVKLKGILVNKNTNFRLLHLGRGCMIEAQEKQIQNECERMNIFQWENRVGRTTLPPGVQESGGDGIWDCRRFWKNRRITQFRE